jgi:hypothetical protein
MPWFIQKIIAIKIQTVCQGPVFRTAADDIPGAVVESRYGDTAFENYFLSWSHPAEKLLLIAHPIIQNILLMINIPNDLSHYEVWMGPRTLSYRLTSFNLAA